MASGRRLDASAKALDAKFNITGLCYLRSSVRKSANGLKAGFR